MRSWVGFSSLDSELGIGSRWGRMVDLEDVMLERGELAKLLLLGLIALCYMDAANRVNIA